MENRFQFTVSSLMVVTALFAVTLAGWMWCSRYLQSVGGIRPVQTLHVTALLTPFWTPIATVAYAVGRKSFTVKMAVVFAMVEAAAIGSMVLIEKNWGVS